MANLTFVLCVLGGCALFIYGPAAVNWILTSPWGALVAGGLLIAGTWQIERAASALDRMSTK